MIIKPDMSEVEAHLPKEDLELFAKSIVLAFENSKNAFDRTYSGYLSQQAPRIRAMINPSINQTHSGGDVMPEDPSNRKSTPIITIYIPDPKNKNYNALKTAQAIPMVVAHEHHHFVRNGIADDLGSYLVSEGLAMHHQEQTGHALPDWMRDIVNKPLSKISDRALNVVNGKGAPFKYPDWFSGKCNGYALGYAIVKDYLESRKGNKSAAEAVKDPVDIILARWKSGDFKPGNTSATSHRIPETSKSNRRFSHRLYTP